MLQKLKSKFTMEGAGVKVNLLTLGISDKKMERDFEQHKIENSNNKQLYWVVLIMIHLNLIFNMLIYFLAEKSAF